MADMIYVLHPLGATVPVRVAPEASITTLAHALEALDFFADDLLDEDWLTTDEPEITADGARLAAAATRYHNLTTRQLEATSRAGADELAGFFAYVDEVDGRSIIIERQR
jgi:hypothetical protein